jgi:hypothetical protein
MRTSKPLVLAILWIMFSLPARGDDKVSGTFTVKGKTTEFRHVYAFWKPRLMDESKLDLYVLLSDEPIAAEGLPLNNDGIAKMAGLVRDDKVHALELHFDGASNKLFAGEEGAVYHIGIAMARQSFSGGVQYTATSTDAITKAGKVSADKNAPGFDGGTCSASFEVGVPKKP